MLALTFAVGGILTAVSAVKCPRDMGSLRTEYVAKSYDPSKLSGFFYEIAYEDILQAGETCQWFNETVVSTGINEEFGFAISKPASTAVRFEDTETAGVYMKYMGSSDVGMPTVVVDVTLSQDGLMYETVTEYTCYADGIKTYEEIKIGARTSSVSASTMASLEDTLHKQGIEYDTLTYVDQENCVYGA
jgi:hypothetical protein